jgi:hypothetical protein
MGTDFSLELGSLAWNECSGTAMENLNTGGSSGVIFSVFGHAVLTPQAHLLFPHSWARISRSN